ncbi:hypothetical protein ACYPKM_04150 [Pseudomonas aeruginosa]
MSDHYSLKHRFAAFKSSITFRDLEEAREFVIKKTGKWHHDSSRSRVVSELIAGNIFVTEEAANPIFNFSRYLCWVIDPAGFTGFLKEGVSRWKSREDVIAWASSDEFAKDRVNIISKDDLRFHEHDLDTVTAMVDGDTSDNTYRMHQAFMSHYNAWEEDQCKPTPHAESVLKAEKFRHQLATYCASAHFATFDEIASCLNQHGPHQGSGRRFLDEPISRIYDGNCYVHEVTDYDADNGVRYESVAVTPHGSLLILESSSSLKEAEAFLLSVEGLGDLAEQIEKSDLPVEMNLTEHVMKEIEGDRSVSTYSKHVAFIQAFNTWAELNAPKPKVSKFRNDRSAPTP